MELWIATQNEHKIKEYKALLEPLGYTVKTLLDLEKIIDIEETGNTFEENAILKAQTLANQYKTTWLADDSGFEVDALDKAPGIFSARFMGEETSYKVKNQAILDQIEHASDRTCRYVCVLAICGADMDPLLFRGETEGAVAFEASGDNGFGYDPIFYYPDFGKTFAQVSDEEKNSVSHRGKACQLLVEYLNENSI